jgi:hypothetical protein
MRCCNVEEGAPNETSAERTAILRLAPQDTVLSGHIRDRPSGGHLNFPTKPNYDDYPHEPTSNGERREQGSSEEAIVVVKLRADEGTVTYRRRKLGASDPARD